MRATLIPMPLPMPSGGAPRSEGIHVSSVIRCIAAESGILKPEYVESLDLVDIEQASWWDSLTAPDQPVPSPNQLRIAIGMAWDGWYLNVLGEAGVLIPHPGEMEVDGIYLTHDGESLDVIRTERISGHVLCLHEVKTTYKSTNTVGDLTTQWLWIAQCKAYCKGLGTNVAYLHVLFLCGDYSYPITPQLLVWRIEFTEAEIEDGWDLILGYVNHRRAEGTL